MHPIQFDLLAQELSRPVDALELLTRALRHRTCGREAEIILDEVELGLGEVRRHFSSVLDLARAERCLAAFERSDFPLAALLERLPLQTDRVVYDTGARLLVVPTRAVVVSDRSALEIILRNLVIAGLHLAESGRVLVGVRSRGREVHVQVWAKPSAPASGIRLQDPFPQGEGASEIPALVLGIARTLAQGLGHELRLRSVANASAVFSLALPRAPGADRPEAISARPAEKCA